MVSQTLEDKLDQFLDENGVFRKSMKKMQEDIKNINENLTNHVTETDQKIDVLNEKVDKLLER